MSQNGQTRFKNLATFSCKLFLFSIIVGNDHLLGETYVELLVDLA